MNEWGEMIGGVPASLGTSMFTERQATVLRRTQDELIDEMQLAADRWCARRHETVEAMFTLGVASLNNNNPVAMTALWMHWCKGALRRLSEDTSDQVGLAVATAKYCSNGALATAPRLDSRNASSPVARRRAKRKAPTRSRRTRRATRRR